MQTLEHTVLHAEGQGEGQGCKVARQLGAPGMQLRQNVSECPHSRTLQQKRIQKQEEKSPSSCKVPPVNGLMS